MDIPQDRPKTDYPELGNKKLRILAGYDVSRINALGQRSVKMTSSCWRIISETKPLRVIGH
jgi:hypothetical protein